MKKISLLTICTLPLLAACGGSSTSSSSEEPYGTAEILAIGSAEPAGFIRSVASSESASGIGRTFFAAGQLDGSLYSYSVIEADPTVGDALTTGSVGYVGSWDVVGLEDVVGTPTTFNSGGNLALNVDFTGGAGTVVSTSTTTGAFSVDGTLSSGGILSGTVNYDGTDAPLDGLIGTDGLLGVFSGSTETSIFSGGLVARPPG